MLILPIDLPGISPAALASVLDVLDDRPAARSSRSWPTATGEAPTPCCWLPPDVIEPGFGGDSHGAHAAAAAAAGARLVELGGPLSADLDTPEDLLLAEARSPESVGG